MRKLLLVAKAEYLRLVKQRSFVLATVGDAALHRRHHGRQHPDRRAAAGEDRPFGVVDQSGILGDVVAAAADQAIIARRFPDEAPPARRWRRARSRRSTWCRRTI